MSRPGQAEATALDSTPGNPRARFEQAQWQYANQSRQCNSRSARLLQTFILYGVFSGLIAVLLMTVFEIPFWYRFGVKGVVQWQVNEIMTSKLFSKPYLEGKLLRWAISMHLFHGIVLGALFSMLLTFVSSAFFSILYLAGLGYSVALWIVVPFSLRGSLQRAGRVNFTTGGMAVSLIAHVVYGLALGELLFLFLR